MRKIGINFSLKRDLDMDEALRKQIRIRLGISVAPGGTA